MKKIWDKVWNSEPVWLLTGLATFMPILLNGLNVFNIWEPDAEVTLYLTGLPAAIALVFGYNVRARVASPETYELLKQAQNPEFP